MGLVCALAACVRTPPQGAPPAQLAQAAVPELAGGPPGPAVADPSGLPASDAPAADAPATPAPVAADVPAPEPPAAASPPATAGSGLARRAAEAAATPAPDPLAPINRRLFAVDSMINDMVAGRLRVLGAARWIPKPVRAGVFNASENLDEPKTVANDLLQRKPPRAARAAARFVINSTVGIGGLFDVAGRLGLKRSQEDFGQTLATFGVGPGPYLFFPIAGPSNLRDAVGIAVDSFISPSRWFGLTLVERRGMTFVKDKIHPSTVAIREIARKARVKGMAMDEYAVLRGLYARQRAAQIADRPTLADDPDIVDHPHDRKRPAAPGGPPLRPPNGPP